MTYDFQEFEGYGKKSRSLCTSKYPGVHFSKHGKKWRAVLKNKHIGYFSDEKEAGDAIQHFIKTGEKPIKKKRLTKKEYGKKMLEEAIKMRVAVMDYMPDGQILVVSPSDYARMIVSLQQISTNNE